MVTQKKSIEITIQADGSVFLNVQGALGAECLDLTAPFEAAAGAVAKREFKSDYYATEQDSQFSTFGSTD